MEGMKAKKASKSKSKIVSTTNRPVLSSPIIRTSNGQFAAGNPGGPGRPRALEDAHRFFLSTVQRILHRPDRFSDFQRDAIVRLATSFMDGPDRQAISAAAVLVAMEQVNIDLGE